ncbi:MAG: hypothetical protein ACWA5P_12750 [bacterium]
MYKRKIVIKFSDQHDYQFSYNGIPIKISGLEGWEDFNKQFQDIHLIEPLFESIRSNFSKDEENNAETKKLLTYFYLVNDIYNVEDVISFLNKEKYKTQQKIEYAYLEPIQLAYPKPPSSTTTSSTSSGRNHLDEAPYGVGAYEILEELESSDFRNVTISHKTVDIEQAWYFCHSDYPENCTSGSTPNCISDGATLEGDDILISGCNEVGIGSALSHGTSVLGILNAIIGNGNNVDGITNNYSHIQCVSASRLDIKGNQYYSLANAIMSAIKDGGLTSGDVLLLEAQYHPDNDNDSLFNGPVELEPATFHAIKAATYFYDISVIEPAGNGEHNLNNLIENNGFSPDSEININLVDSGAIMVGAAKHSKNGWEKHNNSCHGDRLNSFSWGENVFTLTSSRSEQSNGEYTYDEDTSDFSQTSAASAIIAGAVSLLQCYRLKNKKPTFSSTKIREIFSNSEINTKPSENNNIGVMPNLVRIINEYINDHNEDEILCFDNNGTCFENLEGYLECQCVNVSDSEIRFKTKTNNIEGAFLDIFSVKILDTATDIEKNQCKRFLDYSEGLGLDDANFLERLLCNRLFDYPDRFKIETQFHFNNEIEISQLGEEITINRPFNDNPDYIFLRLKASQNNNETNPFLVYQDILKPSKDAWENEFIDLVYGNNQLICKKIPE